MVNINKRQESKFKTRNLILEKTTELISEKGIMSLTTAEIAERCGVSHGNIFQHFGNRETLINSVLEDELKRIAVIIKTRFDETSAPLELLEEYLRVMSSEEAFFMNLYRELPLLPESVTRNVVSMEVILRNTFFLSIKAHCEHLTEKEISIGLDSFFAMIVRFLTLKELYVSDGEVISARKSDLINLFKMLFMKGGGTSAENM